MVVVDAEKDPARIGATLGHGLRLLGPFMASGGGAGRQHPDPGLVWSEVQGSVDHRGV
jgi:hypothetical protein